jgi:hypothetical protein
VPRADEETYDEGVDPMRQLGQNIACFVKNTQKK